MMKNHFTIDLRYTANNMTICALIDLIVADTKVEIYSYDESEVIYSGTEYEIPDKFKGLEVASIEAGNEVLVINI